MISLRENSILEASSRRKSSDLVNIQLGAEILFIDEAFKNGASVLAATAGQGIGLFLVDGFQRFCHLPVVG